MERAMDWNGAERRTGSEQRVAVMEWDEERRHEERRRGGIGTHRPDPVAALLEGMDTRPPDPVSIAQAAAEVRREEEASAARRWPSVLRPSHEPHDAIPAVAGHPLHPAVVALPIGAFTGALAADLAFAATGDRFFARGSRLLTGAALATGLAAGALGAVDFVGRSAIRSHAASWVHAGGNVAALGLGAASLAVRALAADDRRGVLPAGLALSAAAGAVLLVTGWLGGELSYRHRIGVMPAEGASTGDGGSMGRMT